ncbi:MAG: hypothetical protein E4H36_12730 [Spirochaetales bacterium]|nr:MAG: hypothetical protein E4H36_12730 [Spirochaetales bacterium]
MADTDREFLKASILTDARAEAERMLAEAEKTVRQKRELSQSQTDRIRAEAEVRAGEQAGAIERSSRSALELEARRNMLKAQDALLKTVLQKVRDKLGGLASGPAYRDVLKNLLVEGVLGLSVPKVLFNATAAELALIDEALLEEVRKRVKELDGPEVDLKRSGDKPLKDAGVMLFSEDGRLCFNNQFKNRMRRFETEIRKLTAKELFEG